MKIPLGFEHKVGSGNVCKLKRSIWFKAVNKGLVQEIQHNPKPVRV